MSVYVITWNYFDNSGSGIVGIYADEKMALEVFKGLKGFSIDREFEFQSMEVVQ